MDLTSDANLNGEKFVINESYSSHQQFYKDDDNRMGLSSQLEMCNKVSPPQYGNTQSVGMAHTADATNNSQKPRWYVPAFNPICNTICIKMPRSYDLDYFVIP